MISPKKKFLEDVLKAMTVDVSGELIKAVHTLEHIMSTKEEKIDALNVIRDYIDNIDFANSFVKIGGTGVLLSCIRDDDAFVRTSSINVMAEMSQNNVFCQQHFLDTDIIKDLVTYLNDGDEQVVASSLYALSSLMQNFEPATYEFSKCGGVSHVLNCLSTKCSRVFIKACFLISSISSQFSIIRDEFVKGNAFGKLSENLECVDDFDVKAEALLIALSKLIESEHFKPDYNGKDKIFRILKEILNNIKSLPQCEAEKHASHRKRRRDLVEELQQQQQQQQHSRLPMIAT